MDFEVPADIDLSQCPGLVPTPKNCPVWKKEMIDKKNKDRVEEYVRDILRDREEQKKWKDVPEWKRKVLKQKSDEARAKEKAVKEGRAPPPEISDKPCSQKELLHAGQSHHDDDFVPAAMNIDPEEFESMPPWKQELLTKRKNIPVTFNNEFNPDEEEEPQQQNYDLDVQMAS
ncbi:hypothetical protein LOTGIDRAFT_229997 [Lottia gigantea]|uniref:Uncharacterized protein n=1 Tax=Lottia gigantea TaxID=225164 RepID=V4CR22_LOTGI|nr:hypothetical protein LOTGIDRAFT_229997 [Lottia gigantea]ESP04925.1 hypothetical protein LOTGIDRAFT_229997 [Lottia gigantea]